MGVDMVCMLGRFLGLSSGGGVLWQEIIRCVERVYVGEIETC
jgi:hypothetical protein